MSLLNSPARLVGGVRDLFGRGPREGERFLDRPYASVQLLLLAAAGLLGFGILMAVSTTIAASNQADGSGTGGIWTQVIKEAEFVAIGLPIFWFAMRMSPRAYRMLAYPIMIIGIIALIAVLIPGIGFGVYGARRWIDLGPFQLQPSEFAKIGVLLWGGDLLARKQQLGTLRRARHLFLPLLPGFAFVAMLVMLEPDLGTTCCYVLILLGLLWMVGMPLRYFATVVALIGGVITLLAVTEPYRLARLTSFIHPFKDPNGADYHAVQSIYALGSGGLWGVGLGEGTSKYWVPNANTDFVFSIIGEELGLLGATVVLALFALLAYSGIRVARRSADPFVRLVAGAATVWLCGQAVINIGYVTALVPVTGIPLPFISAGGTSLLASFFVLGMLVSFARHEAPAVTMARRDERRGERSRLQRWLRIPVPKPYQPPKRRSRPRPAATRPAAPRRQHQPAPRRTAAAPRSPQRAPLRPTGTDGQRRAR